MFYNFEGIKEVQIVAKENIQFSAENSLGWDHLIPELGGGMFFYCSPRMKIYLVHETMEKNIC